MLEVLVYPVSAVIKCWHWLLVTVLGMDTSSAWVASVVLLVVTVRALVLPFAMAQYRVGRVAFLMRPHMARIEEQYGSATTPEAIEAEQKERKKVQEDHNYSLAAGCVPALVQFPVFIGLYRLLRWMAVPTDGDSHRIGILNAQDLETFRAATLFDAPLPAYVAMSQEHLAALGTTEAQVRAVALPMVIAAVIFTCTNLAISQLRNRSTLDWENGMTRKSYRVLWWAIPVIALSLTTAGLSGIVPVAVLLYWVSGNLWTMVQTAALWAWSVRRLPAEEMHREHWRTAKARIAEQHSEQVERKRARRRLRRQALRHPGQASEVFAQLRAEKQERKAEKVQEKREKKELKRTRNAASQELARRRREAKQAAAAEENPAEN